MLTATFNRVDGLVVGDEVRLGGIRVGSVQRMTLVDDFRARIALQLDAGVRLPTDSAAAIHTDGLFGSKFVVLDPGDTVAAIASDGILGGKYVRLEPGRDEMPLESGEIISRTKDFRSLEDQVGEIIFLATGGNDSNGSGD